MRSFVHWFFASSRVPFAARDDAPQPASLRGLRRIVRMGHPHDGLLRRRSVRQMAASAARRFVSVMDAQIVVEGKKRQTVPTAPTGAADEVKRACGPDQM